MSRQAGHGLSTGHHGEIIQGYFADDEAAAGGRHGLVTLPCPGLISEAWVQRTDRARGVVDELGGRAKAAAAGNATLEAFGATRIGLRLHVRSTIPIGHGFGSSSADVVATIRAVCDLLGVVIAPRELAELAVAAEVAADPLMFEEVVLFAQRAGVVIEELGRRLPPLRVLGFYSAPHGPGVDTLAQPPIRYPLQERGEFERLRERLAVAVREGDAGGLGAVATASASISHRHLAVPQLDAFLEIAEAVGAVGLQVAHSGDVAGLLFEGDDPTAGGRMVRAQRLLARCGVGATWSFSPDDTAGVDATLPAVAAAGHARRAATGSAS